MFLIVPDAVKRLRHRLPHVRIRLVEGLTQSLVPLVRDETLDFAIGQSAGARPDNAIRFAPLISVHLIIAGRRNHPLAAAKSLRELAEAPWVAFAPPGQADFLRRAYEAVGMAPPRDVVQCGSYASALALMMHTDALGMIVPQLLAEPQMRGSLQQIRIAEPLPTLTFGMFRRADAPLSAAAKAMAEAVSATARILARDNR